MWYHRDLHWLQLGRLIHQEKITLGGNQSLKIYGTLSCYSGKRMKNANRVFFADEAEAIRNGYRPCAHCRRAAYLNWKLIAGSK
ncbi:Ada metal-binding domain-containing protein [Chitinophaga arvensicola]|uniref:Metal binding domain of Ada n=1 Tax=Chitinophaga arvensicola TaxID=29529 RepID=A0A1I0RES0_9BACT|nr:Ada metal-binding domain-containing protein [Chitinophaga arvensicola]SEW39131.1 Metal binding domain of Ada [Chitinophaga arvensicola]